ncbi:unnamed protein product [Calypogeia fissa]
MCLSNMLHSVLTSLGRPQKVPKILFLGLDKSGKTTLIRMITAEHFVQHQRKVRARHLSQNQLTHYPPFAELSIGKLKVKALDFSSQQMGGGLWEDCCTKVAGIVYVVDAADQDRFQESKKELDALLSDESMARIPFLVLGNKADIPDASSEYELRHFLGLTHLTTGKWKVNVREVNIRPIEVFMCSAVRQMGYRAGLTWMSEYIK